MRNPSRKKGMLFTQSPLVVFICLSFLLFGSCARARAPGKEPHYVDSYDEKILSNIFITTEIDGEKEVRSFFEANPRFDVNLAPKTVSSPSEGSLPNSYSPGFSSDNHGMTLLHILCVFNQSVPLFDFLLSRGAIIDAPDKLGLMPIYYAFNGYKTDPAFLDRLLAAYGLGINDPILVGKSLRLTLRDGFEYVFTLDSKSPIRLNLIQVAAQSNNTATLAYCVGKGARLDAAGSLGYTALDYSAHSLPMFRWLVEHGAKIDESKARFLDFLPYGDPKEARDLFEYLIHERGMRMEGFSGFAQCRIFWNFMYRLGAKEPGLSEADVFTLLEYLIANGLSVNADSTLMSGGIRPLHMAALAGDAAMVKFLVAHGADPKLRTAINCAFVTMGSKYKMPSLASAVDIAKKRRDKEIIELLK